MHKSEKWKWKWSRVQLLVTPWTAAYQAPPSMGLSRQEYWSGVPLPSLLYGRTMLKQVRSWYNKHLINSYILLDGTCIHLWRQHYQWAVSVWYFLMRSIYSCQTVLRLNLPSKGLENSQSHLLFQCLGQWKITRVQKPCRCWNVGFWKHSIMILAKISKSYQWKYSD